MINSEDLRKLLHEHAELVSTHVGTSVRKYACFEDLIAREGIAYESMPFSEEKYPHALRTQKECFCNAYHLALYEKNLTYVEGYIFFIIPIMHAWCVDECGICGRSHN